MEYVLLVVGDERLWAEASPEERKARYAEWGAYDRFLTERGAALSGYELAGTATATTVRNSGGQVLVTDGPYAETAEQISGYIRVKADNLEQAVELAAKMPADCEIRPIA